MIMKKLLFLSLSFILLLTACEDSSDAAAPGTSEGGGQGGSLARFAIANNTLYTVDDSKLKVFDISEASDPKLKEIVSLNWGVETIFPYNNHLFIGTTTGMHILNAKNPHFPTYVSTYEHVFACDPVVVEGDRAYVTLRSENFCNGVNELHVLDISEVQFPSLIKRYGMRNPYGLGIDNGILFICEGTYGLNVYDAIDPEKITSNQLATFPSIEAYDIIPHNGIAMVIGADGLMQYNYTPDGQVSLLSSMPVYPDL